MAKMDLQVYVMHRDNVLEMHSGVRNALIILASASPIVERWYY